eukprot:TRINITY_DN3049_c1_g1_i1.p1 TRINITY_DN3049_c1_g1~~TRINITY_DN3049_c1_g1_i1.p1  ORF type:complete len:123 (-),score=14.00 TRINITY_DN3049_c1_g1_i1:38-406(-)
MVIANPPYIKPQQYAKLSPEVKDWEDKQALVGTYHKNQKSERKRPDGLDFYREILSRALPFLKQPEDEESRGSIEQRLPALVFEFGADQGKAMTRLITRYPVGQYQLHKDLSNKDRWVEIFL